MGVSDQRDRIFSFFLGRLGERLFILFEGFGSVYFVEMVLLDSLQALSFRHRFLIEIPLVLGEGSGVLLTLNFLDSQLFFAKVMTNHTL